MKNSKAIGFDFDGTLVMSEKGKAQAMARVFATAYGIRKGVETAYRNIAGSGLNRREKIELLIRKLLKRRPTAAELHRLDQAFGKAYEQSLRTCPLFQCTNVIKELKKQVDFLFLLSLENKREVVKVLRHCGLYGYFDEILGGPRSKRENLQHVLKKHHLRPEEVLYIGDSASDVVTSRKAGIRVVLIRQKFAYRQLLEKLQADFVFSSLCELPYQIERFSR